jgi:hypothetical protein
MCLHQFFHNSREGLPVLMNCIKQCFFLITGRFKTRSACTWIIAFALEQKTSEVDP